MLVDLNPIFDVHERQGKPVSLIAMMRRLTMDEQLIDGAGYRPEISTEKKRAVRAEVVAQFVAEIRRLKAEAENAGAAALDSFDAAQATAATGPRRTVDVTRLNGAVHPSELGLQMKEAISAAKKSGDARYARYLWLHCEPVFLRRRSEEFNKNILPSGNTWFSWHTLLKSEMAVLNSQQPSRSEMASRQQSAVDVIERHALEIAAVVGLDAAVKAALVRANVSAPTRASAGMVFGTAFEKR